MKPNRHPRRQGVSHPLRPLALAAACASLSVPTAHAFQFDTGVPGLRANWDNTLKYSNAFRVKSPSPAIVGGENYDPASPFYFPDTDDGSNNFKRGLVSNRLDLFSEFDLTYRSFGVRLSGAGWYDSVYNTRNDNASPATVNQISAPYNEFPQATRSLHGRKAELLDAFVFGKFNLGGSSLGLRLGKHTVLYGESLFFGSNGIAAAQAPVDVVKALSVPNAQFKEFMMPINQVSGQLQLSPDLSIGAYYQLDWKADRLPGVGSYFSFVDVLGAGAERLIVSFPGVGPTAFLTEPDRKPKWSGQGGLQMRFRVDESDFGLYAVRWNSRSPAGQYLHQGVPNFGANPPVLGTYQLVYHNGINAYGASASSSFGSTNVAAEVSLRTNMPLDSDPQADPNAAGPSDPLYGVGKSAHAQVSWITSISDNFLSREADFIGELAWNRLLSVTKNAAAVTPDTTRDAANLRMVFEPKYRQVIDGLDLGVPLGVGVGLVGNSAVVGFAGKNTGDMSIGLNGTYLDVWRMGLSYMHYFGKAGPFVSGGHHRFNQFYADRDYVSFSVRRTF